MLVLVLQPLPPFCAYACCCLQLLRRAFTYNWRLWSVADVAELLREAGFSKVAVWVKQLQVRQAQQEVPVMYCFSAAACAVSQLPATESWCGGHVCGFGGSCAPGRTSILQHQKTDGHECHPAAV
jgi:hypothetical protein